MAVLTGPETPQLHRARSVLGVLAERGGLEGLPATEALMTLELVHPPLPPLERVGPGSATVDDGLAALNEAAAAAADPAEAARIALAAEALRIPVLG